MSILGNYSRKSSGKEMFNCECFTIDVSVQKSRPFVEKDRKTVLRFAPSHWWSLFSPTIMKADPFLFVHHDTLFLFYEDMPIGNGLGRIKMLSTNDLKHWSKPVQITHEPECHFSYPWVFEEKGVVYMMPETGCDHNIRLYRATNDGLTDWVVDAIILERKDEARIGIKYDFADSCIYRKDDVYYLFTSYYKNDEYFLELYTSYNLKGPYTIHPGSPICTGNKFGRCAGSIIAVDGKIYRPVQDCVTVYGGQTHILEIDELTPTTYKEHVVRENIIPQDEAFFRNGGHQINFAEYKGQTVVTTDSRYMCTFYLERIRIKLLKLLGIKDNRPY